MCWCRISQLLLENIRGDHFWFDSVRFFRTKTGSNRFGSVFSVLAWFFPVWLGFFPVWLGLFSGFFQFGFGSVRFGFFGFRLIKSKPNRNGRIFQNFNRFNRFFFTVRFFRLFFSGFLSFLDFLLTPRKYIYFLWILREKIQILKQVFKIKVFFSWFSQK
jgi:hypothetical protein